MSNTNPTDQRAKVIAGLRDLADLLERVPDLPTPDRFSHCLITEDAEANETLDRIEATLNDSGVEFTTSNRPDHGREVTAQIGGVSYRIFIVWTQAMEEHDARQSYTRNVQVDEPAAAVTA